MRVVSFYANPGSSDRPGCGASRGWLASYTCSTLGIALIECEAAQQGMWNWDSKDELQEFRASSEEFAEDGCLGTVCQNSLPARHSRAGTDAGHSDWHNDSG